MPGVTIDGRDPVAVYETVGAAVARARAGEGPTLVESQMYRLSAHGNIIAPPGVPLHFPEHEAIEKFGAPEEYEAAKKGDPVPAFRGRLVADGDAHGRGGRRDRRERARRDAGGGHASASRAPSRTPAKPSPTSTPRSGVMAHELPYIAAIGEAIHLEMERDESVLYFGQNMATTENEPFVDAFGQGPRARHADLRDGRDRHRDRRRAVRLPAGGRALHGRVHARRDGPGAERGAPLPRDERRPGQGADRAQGRLRLHRRLGGPAHRHDQRALHGRAGPEGRRAVDGGRRQGPDGDARSATTTRSSTCTTTCSRSSTARCPTASTSSRSARPRSGARAATSRSSRRAGASTARSTRPSSWPRRASRPR